MTRTVFIDTSAWISYILSRQPRHSTIKNLIKQFVKNNTVIYTSNDVIDETTTRLIYDTNSKIVERFVNFITDGAKRGSILQLWVDEEIQGQAFELVQKFSEHRLSLTDATTVSLAKKFNIEAILTLDSDFTKIKAPVFPLY